MCTGFTRDTHQYFMKASPVRPGDFIEFFAEIDLLGALSACPGGDCGATHSERRRQVLSAEGRDLPARRRRARRLAVAAAQSVQPQPRRHQRLTPAAPPDGRPVIAARHARGRSWPPPRWACRTAAASGPESAPASRAARRAHAVSASSGASAPASVSPLHASWMYSGNAFSSATRFASTIECTLTRRRKLHGDRIDLVGDHHRHAGDAELQRHGARSGERRARQLEGAELVLFAVEQGRRHRASRRLRLRCDPCTMRHRRDDHPWRMPHRLQPRHRVAERLHQPRHLRGAAAGQHHQQRLARRRGPAAPPAARDRARRSTSSRSIIGWPI